MLDYDYYPPGTPSGAGKTSDILGPYGSNLHFEYDGMLTMSTSWSGDVTGSVAWQYNSDFNKILETVTGQTGSSSTVFGYDNDQLLTCASWTSCSGWDAQEEAARRYPGETHNGRGDAYKHCVASCKVAQRSGSTYAWLLGELNEWKGDLLGQPENERRMDDYSNACGRSYATENEENDTDCSLACLDALESGVLETL
jgi:hypothetical protein